MTLKPFESKRTLFYLFIITAIPYFLGLLVIKPVPTQSAFNGYITNYFIYIFCILSWLFITALLIKSRALLEKSPWNARFLIILGALYGIFTIGLFNYRFREFPYLLEVFILTVGATPLRLVFQAQRRFLFFFIATIIYYLGVGYGAIFVLRAEHGITPFLYALSASLIATAGKLSRNFSQKNGFELLESRSRLLGITLSLPPVILGILSVLKIFPSPLATGLILTVPLFSQLSTKATQFNDKSRLTYETVTRSLLFIVITLLLSII